jgi:hypothetical protein
MIVDPARRAGRRTYLGGIDHGGRQACTAPAFAPEAITMSIPPLRLDERHSTRPEPLSG